MTTPDEQFAQVFLRLRTPLARVELAASRLARFATTPAARGLATGISEAVQEIDQEIQRSLEAARPRRPMEGDFGDCRDVLPALRDRMAAVLSAQEIEWTEMDAPEPEGPILADRHSVARAAVVMLRAAIALIGPGGSFALQLCEHADTNDPGLRLDAQCAKRPVEVAVPEFDPLAEPLSFALRRRGCLEVQHRGANVTATLWLGQELGGAFGLHGDESDGR